MYIDSNKFLIQNQPIMIGVIKPLNFNVEQGPPSYPNNKPKKVEKITIKDKRIGTLIC